MEVKVKRVVKVKGKKNQWWYHFTNGGRQDGKVMKLYISRDASDIIELKKTITMHEFTSTRDYLLMQLCVDNASHTGALANMTCDEFRKVSRSSNESG